MRALHRPRLIAMKHILDTTALNQLFVEARTANRFSSEPLARELMERIYDLAKMPPTSMNCQPARYVFLESRAARERIVPALMGSNQEKTLNAPVCVVIATDSLFYERMHEVWHDAGARDFFANNPAIAAATAQRNSTLSGAYFIMAARALGLACGPMSGFDPAAVNRTFFPDGRYSVNFLLNLGYPSDAAEHPRNPRLAFDQVAQVL
jgi:3-hydroxypropanoate dehydrogenase